MGGCLRGGAVVMVLYPVGLVSAFVAVIEMAGGAIGEAIVFGVVAYLCWLGIVKLTADEEPH